MTPTEPGSQGIPPSVPETVPEPLATLGPRYRWYHKMSAVVFITFCLEIGIFLTVFPWLPDYWDSNFFVTLVPEWHRYWDNMYVRGAVSGLGAVNLYISLIEVTRLRRFAKR